MLINAPIKSPVRHRRRPIESIKDKNIVCNTVGMVQGAVEVDAKFSMPWRPGTPKIKTMASWTSEK